MTTEPDKAPLNPMPDAEAPAPGDSAVPAPETVAAYTDRVSELEAEAARMKDHMLRALADAENTRKRALRERDDATKFAISGFARDMLDTADNLRRAIDAIPEDQRAANAALIEGLEAVERGLLKTFEKHGIRKLEPMGETFDPNFHEVMFEAPVPGKAAGIIIQLVEPGYMLNDRLLRPARVGIAKGDPGGGDPSRHIDETA